MGHGEHDEWFFKYPSVYRFLRGAINLDRFTRPVGEYLKARPDETVIDVGCGVGDFSRLVPANYKGYDLNERFVRYAQKKWGNPGKHFYCRDVLELSDEERFDKGMVVNILHHFDDAELRRLLAKLARLVKNYFVIVDADWDSSGRFQRWLLKKDQGSYLRSRKNLQALLSEYFDLKDFSVFNSRSGSVCLFRCRAYPKTGER